MMTPDLLAPTIDEMIKEVEREIALRRRVYPEFVRSRRISQERADRQIQVMEAIVAKLHEIKADGRV